MRKRPRKRTTADQHRATDSGQPTQRRETGKMASVFGVAAWGAHVGLGCAVGYLGGGGNGGSAAVAVLLYLAALILALCAIVTGASSVADHRRRFGRGSEDEVGAFGLALGVLALIPAVLAAWFALSFRG